MTKEEQAFNEAAEKISDAVKSQMFGKPCFKINGKAFSCFYIGDMVFKLSGDAHKKAISLDGTQLFDPGDMGRPMKEWVRVPYEYHDQWDEFAGAAADYVRKAKK